MNPPPEEPTPLDEDLGFGGVVAQRTRGRFLRRDGSPGVRKYGLGQQFGSRAFLHTLAAPWPRFLVWSIGLMLLLNGVFALAFVALPDGSLAGTEAMQLSDPFLRAYAYSIGIFTGVGAAPMHPVGATANWLTTFESLFGILWVIALLGVMLTKMTRPRARIRFTESAIIAPYEGGRALMFRMVNTSPTELYEVTARINLAMFVTSDGKQERDFFQLDLERSSVEFFPLHWTVVHPITADSPLANLTPDLLRESKAEFLVFVSALEDTFSTRVNSRTSYLWDEIRWDVKFADIFVDSPDGVITIDAERLDKLERLEEGATGRPSAKESLVVSR